MIPMRQLHTPVYNRNNVIARVGSEDAVNDLAIEFVKHAPGKIRQIGEGLEAGELEDVAELSIVLSQMAAAAGAEQIYAFARDIAEEMDEIDPNLDRAKIALALIGTSLEQFMVLLSHHVDWC